MKRLLALALLLTTTAPAWADPASEERARILYAAGKDHYDHGRYEAAVAEFENAFALAPRPELRYNLYLAYERMGRFDKALDHLDAYLAEGTMPAEERSRLEARRDALRARAAAVPPPGAPPPPARQNTGFMVRLGLGAGYASAENDYYRLYGGTGDLTLAVGWRIIDKLSLHLSLWGAAMVGSTIEGKGFLSGIITKDTETKYTAGAVGAGATVYLPLQFYLTGSVGAGSASTERDGKKDESDAGFAVLVGAGKEWTISGDLGFGVAANLSIMSIHSKLAGDNVTQKVTSSLVMVSLLATLAYD